MEYKPGQILNFAWSGFLPFLETIGNNIHYSGQDRYDWSHTARVGRVDKNGIFVIEALSDTGITGSYYSKEWLDNQYENGKLAIGTIPGYTSEHAKRLMQFYDLHKGEAYDKMNLFAIGKYWLTGKTTIDKTDNWICSEYQDASIQFETMNDLKISIYKELKLPSDDYVSPMDFFIYPKISWSYK